MSDDSSLKPDQEMIDYIEGKRDTFNVAIAAGTHAEAREIAEGMLEQIRELPPKWSEPLSVSSVPPCTCSNRLPGMLHFEDCPRYAGQEEFARQYRNSLQLIPEREANLGLATTEELLQELIARGRVESVAGEHATCGEAMARDCQQILDDLPPKMRGYKTVFGIA